jgi:hypothetical protein
MTNQPTAEGMRRYPHTAGFFPDLSQADTAPDFELPCTCKVECRARCAGECGCSACDMAFVEFCDEAGFGDVDTDEKQGRALRAYRHGSAEALGQASGAQ